VILEGHIPPTTHLRIYKASETCFTSLQDKAGSRGREKQDQPIHPTVEARYVSLYNSVCF
jgi:hypothetical protein